MKAKDLKNSILQMAVQGKLVPQDPNDEPASVLLERIRAERAQLIKEKKIKKPKGGESVIYRASDGSHYEKRGNGEPVCIDDEIPFEIPESWVWCRLGQVMDLLSGFAFKSSAFKTHGQFRLLRGINLDVGTVRWDETVFLDVLPDGAEQFRLQPGDLLLGLDRPWIKNGLRTAVITNADNTFLVQRVLRIRGINDCSVRYANAVLNSTLFSSHVHNDMTGISVPHISPGQVSSTLFPLPPINEQNRIADKLAMVMRMVPSFGVLEDARVTIDSELPSRLRKSVLQMAVQGKLVPQNPDDEPACALLERIRAERRKLVAAGRAKAPKGGESIIYRRSDGGYYEKRGKGEPVCIDDEIPFEIPESWEWSRLGSLAYFSGGGTPDKGNPRFWNGDIPWASMKDVHGDYLESTLDSITEEGLASKPSISICKPGQIIVSTRLVPGKTIISRIECAINQDLKVVQTPLPAPYLRLWFESHLDEFKRLGMGTTVPGIKLRDLENALIPVPPVQEQYRIADRFGSLSLSATNL